MVLSERCSSGIRQGNLTGTLGDGGVSRREGGWPRRVGGEGVPSMGGLLPVAITSKGAMPIPQYM